MLKSSTQFHYPQGQFSTKVESSSFLERYIYCFHHLHALTPFQETLISVFSHLKSQINNRFLLMAKDTWIQNLSSILFVKKGVVFPCTDRTTSYLMSRDILKYDDHSDRADLCSNFSPLISIL